MKFVLPYCYEVSVKLPRNRNPVGRRPPAMIEVDIPVLSTEEAPIAVRWSEKGTFYRDGKPTEGRATMDVRWHDGKFYRPLASNRFEPGSRATVEMLANHIDRDIAGRLFYVFCRDYDTQPVCDMMTRIKDGRLEYMLNGYMERNAEILESKFDETTARLRAALSDYVIIEDDIWDRVEEPVLVIGNPAGEKIDTRHGHCRGGALGITCDGAPYGGRWEAFGVRWCNGGVGATKTFRIDRYDEVAEFLGGTRYPKDTLGRHYALFEVAVDGVEVLMPEVLRFDADLNAVARQVAHCASLAKKDMPDDVNAAALRAEVRGRLAAYASDGDADHLRLATEGAITLYALIGDGLTAEHRQALEDLQTLDENLPISIDEPSPRP